MQPELGGCAGSLLLSKPLDQYLDIMENRKPRKLGIRSLFRRRNTGPSLESQSTSSQTDNNVSPGIAEDYGDRERSIARYKEAAKILKKSIEIRQGSWGSFDLSGLTGEPGDFDDAQFRNKINLALTSKEANIKDRESCSKCRYTIECLFTALSPFAKNFLTVAKNAQSVWTSFLCYLCSF
jgi:hypothetical protein